MAQYMSGSTAVELDHEELGQHLTLVTGRPRRARHEQPQTRVAAKTQTELSPLVVTALKCAAVFVAALAAVSIVRVLLVATAFGFASQNATMNAQLETARSQGAELEVQQSVYGSSERIKSIATDVYGMVPAADVAVLDLQAVASPETETE